jgi:hypothetical protein
MYLKNKKNRNVIYYNKLILILKPDKHQTKLLLDTTKEDTLSCHIM